MGEIATIVGLLGACLVALILVLVARREAGAQREQAEKDVAEIKDEARALLSMLSEEQRKEAVFDTRTYGDIVTANAEKVDPLAPPVGIAAAKLDEKQKAQLLKLIDVYASSFEPGLAQARMARVREGSIDTIRFGWAGALAVIVTTLGFAAGTSSTAAQSAASARAAAEKAFRAGKLDEVHALAQATPADETIAILNARAYIAQGDYPKAEQILTPLAAARRSPARRRRGRAWRRT